MSHDRDPLLRAVRDGDIACPDGEALAELGRQTRNHSTLPSKVDLVARVMARLDAHVSEASVSGDDLADENIDALFNDTAGAIPEDLLRLSQLVRNASTLPHSVDLEHRVRASIAAGGSLRTLNKKPVDASARFRIWSAVIAGHVAALLAVSTWQFGSVSAANGNDLASASTSSLAAPNVGAQQGPAHKGAESARTLPPISWQTITRQGDDLFATRRTAERRQQALEAVELADDNSLITGTLTWLQQQQDPVTGHFGIIADQPERDVATQSLATLALLSSGVEDEARSQATRLAVQWIMDHRDSVPTDSVAAGLASLALVEGAVLLRDPNIRDAAERAVAGPQPDQPGPNGLNGFAWLAIETAATAGLQVPGRERASAERNLAMPFTSSNDAGRVGLAAFARLISNRQNLSSTDLLLTNLQQTSMRPQRDAAGRIDPLGTLFATWAMRQAGGEAWENWAREQSTVIRQVIHHTDTAARVDAADVRFADNMPNGDVYATAVTSLALQAAFHHVR